MDYLELTYSEERLPRSAYPEELTDWLIANVFRRPGTFVDIGCGRGEFLRAFASRGFDVIGIDSARSARTMVEGLRVEVADVEQESLPLPDGSIDYVYSKSVIEHLHRPASMLSECARVLKGGGLAVILTPSWRHQSKVFYEDFTHVSPFTANGLRDAMTLAGFSDVEVRVFWQLPILWRRPWLYAPIRLIGHLPLPYRPWDPAPWPEAVNKLLRFSKEGMLLGVGRKPRVSASGI